MWIKLISVIIITFMGILFSYLMDIPLTFSIIAIVFVNLVYLMETNPS